MDTAQWPQQGIGLVESDERQPQIQVERRARPQKEHAINCPRCDSTNTKFCYYNNYSLSQPRYFCKTCRRYWTAGGTLRNVPVGGGSRKNKRSSSSSNSSSSPTLHSSTATATKTAIPLPSTSSTNPQPSHDLIHLAYKLYHGGHDLNLSFPNRTLGGSFLSAGQFVPEPLPSPAPGSLFGAGLGFQELMRPPASSMKMQPLNGVGGGDGRLLFPFEDLKHVSMINESDEAVVEGHHGDPTFFWNGIMGNGGAGNGGSW